MKDFTPHIHLLPFYPPGRPLGYEPTVGHFVELAEYQNLYSALRRTTEQLNKTRRLVREIAEGAADILRETEP